LLAFGLPTEGSVLACAERPEDGHDEDDPGERQPARVPA